MARPRELPTPPGARGLPLLGETLDFLRSPDSFAVPRRARFGPIFTANLFGKPTVFMTGAAANHWIYAGEGKYLENQWLPATRKLLGQTSLSLISGDEHKQRRKLLAPYFKRTSMAGCVPGMLAVAERHLARWATDAELGPLTVVPRMRSLAFEIAAAYVLGDAIVELDVSLDQFAAEFTTWTAGMFAPVPVAIPGSKFARALDARARMFGRLDQLVAAREASATTGAPSGPDILSALLEVRDEHGQPLPRATIVDELQLLLFAGHDTTVTGTSNLLYHLAQHEQVRARAQAEQDALGDAPLSSASIRAMPYLDAVIKESLRLIPPIGGAFRIMREDAEFGGYRIPKGWRIAVGPRSVHWEREYYAEPDRFDPDRWLGAEDHPPFSYIPFGGGPRICLGQHFALLQMQIVAALLLRRFDWRLAPGQDLRFTSLPMPQPRSGLILELAPR